MEPEDENALTRSRQKRAAAQILRGPPRVAFLLGVA
jgi:hypothetical protein